MRRYCSLLFFILLIVPILPATAAPGGFPVGPYLMDVTETSATILWESPPSTEGMLYYGANPGNYDKTISVPLGQFHRVVLSGLTPGTTYYYKIATADIATPDGDPQYCFRTAYPGTKTFRFAVYADTSSGRNGFDLDHGRVVRSVMQFTHPEFVFINGDLITDGRSSEDWYRFFQVESELLRNVPVFAAMGNNDQTGRTHFEKYFTSNRGQTYYSFNYGECHFIALDLLRGQGEKYYRSFRPGTPQFAWLLKDLQSEQNQKAKFTIVFFHAPVFPPDGEINRILVELLHPVFVKYGVDLVFNGTHSYTRAEKDGIAYFISGGGGAEMKSGRKNKLLEIKETAYLLHHLRVSVDYPVVTVDVVDTKGVSFLLSPIGPPKRWGIPERKPTPPDPTLPCHRRKKSLLLRLLSLLYPDVTTAGS